MRKSLWEKKEKETDRAWKGGRGYREEVTAELGLKARGVW